MSEIVSTDRQRQIWLPREAEFFSDKKSETPLIKKKGLILSLRKKKKKKSGKQSIFIHKSTKIFLLPPPHFVAENYYTIQVYVYI